MAGIRQEAEIERVHLQVNPNGYAPDQLPAANHAHFYLEDDGAGNIEVWVYDSAGNAMLINSSSLGLDDLTDVDLTTPPTDGQALVYENASGQWKPADVAAGSVAAADVTFTPAGGIAAANVQAAIEELDTEKAASSHGHAASAITNTPAGNIAATDVQAAINELDTEKAASGHTHALADMSDVGTAADTANFVLATPSGSVGPYSGRALVAADIPNIPASRITSGELAKARGGWGTDVSSAATQNAIVGLNSSGVATRIGWYPDKATDPGASHDSSFGYVVGSLWFNTVNQKLWYCVDNTISAAVWSELTGGGSTPGVVDPKTFDARLTLETGVAISKTDQLAKGTVYLTPHNGNILALPDGSGNWDYVELTSEISLSLAGLTANRMADFFVYNNAGTPVLEGVSWTNDTTRATALTYVDGVPLKSGATTRRLIGSGFVNSSNQCNMRFNGGVAAGAAAECGLQNIAYREPMEFSILDTTTTLWTVPGGTALQSWNSSANNRIYVVRSLDDLPIWVTFAALHSVNPSGTAGVHIGLDSTTTAASTRAAMSNSTPTILTVATADYLGHPGLGRHYLQLLEKANTANATNFWGALGGGFDAKYGGHVLLWA